jgi:hypothetical protein
MRADKLRILIALIAMWLIPFATWGVLWIARKVYSPNLRPLLPSLKALRWLFWFIGCSVSTAGLLSDAVHWLFPIGMGIWGISSGLSFPESWLKRHYAPESLGSEPPDEWWPTART